MTPMANNEELIVYSNSRNGLGIRVLGAKRPTHRSGIYIKQLLDDGLARKDGRLKVGDQILSINDEPAIGINREHAVNILRSSAATNQVRLYVRHFFPHFSNEYQKYLFDEKSTDDDDDEIHRFLNHSQDRNNNNRSATTTADEVRMRRSARRNPEGQPYRHSTHDPLSDHRKDRVELHGKDSDVSHIALQSLLNSRFQIIDLVDLLKKTYPNLLSNDQKRELQFTQQLSETSPDGRISLKDFERQSSVLLSERINLLTPFYSSSTRSTTSNENEIIAELRRQIASCRSTIDELQEKILTCEKSQRLSEQVELEYEDLLKFVYEQLRQYKSNEVNQLRMIQGNDQLIRKLLNYLSTNLNKPDDQQILSQLKYEYEQQQRILSPAVQPNSSENSILSKKKHQQQI